MAILTGTENALSEYYLAIQSKDYIDEQDIQHLLDSYRQALHVDTAYVAEIKLDRKACFIPMQASRTKNIIFWGRNGR